VTASTVKTCTAIVVLACSVLVAGGCGGGGSARLTGVAYSERMRAISSELSASLGSVGWAGTLADATRAVEFLQSDAYVAAATMDTLSPPTDIEVEHGRLARALRELGRELRPLIVRLERGDLRPLTQIESLRAFRKVQQIATLITLDGYDLSPG
jgi:hypothetical protein